MNSLKKLFPISWHFKKDVPSVLLGMLIYFGAMVVINILFSIISTVAINIIFEVVPFDMRTMVGTVVSTVFSAIVKFAELYIGIGVLLEVLLVSNVIKSDNQ